jgi:GNAT superfamily N-acetyltransferase
VTEWTSDRIWDAVDAWRWTPPSAVRATTDEFELAVTPGSYALTYVYGFHVDEPERADARLDEVRARIEALGGTGARFQVTPRSRPTDLADRLRRHGYRQVEETEVLVWKLRDREGKQRLPEFRTPVGLTVREIATERELRIFWELSTKIFGDPVPSEESRRGFLSEFHRRLKETQHSERFLAWDAEVPIGHAGMEIAGPIARFWGTGVLTEHRNRGVYGALVQARCESAAQRGAEIVLVTARVGTSGPILKRHGFEPLGSVRIFEVRW